MEPSPGQRGYSELRVAIHEGNLANRLPVAPANIPTHHFSPQASKLIDDEYYALLRLSLITAIVAKDE